MKFKFQYFTDAEGDYEFFKKQIRQSEILHFTDEGESKIEFLNDNSNELLVFGGDVCDRGDDISLTEALVKLKERYPNRVVLIVGNRDANKTRFSTELPLDPNEKLDENLEAVITPPGARKSYKEFLGAGPNTPVNRLKWILEFTMGSPTAFECRRKELARIKKQDVSDIEVYQSFRESVEPQGFMRKYLSLAQIGAVIGDTVIVHGGVSAKNIGKVPDGFKLFETEHAKPGMLYFDTVIEWINQLNGWYQQAIKRWVETPRQSKDYCYSDSVPASPLQHMSNDAGSYFEGQLPVVGNFFGQDRVTPALLTEDVASYLKKSGINRVMAGHQPNSGMPLFLVGTANEIIDDRSIQIYTCDTLYGNRMAYDPEQGNSIRATDPRGSSCAIVHVVCEQENKSSVTSIKGVDGFNVHYQRSVHYPRLEDEDPYIGRMLKIDGKIYTVRVNFSSDPDKPYVLTHTANNFAISSLHVNQDDLASYSEAGFFLNESQFLARKSVGLF